MKHKENKRRQLERTIYPLPSMFNYMLMTPGKLAGLKERAGFSGFTAFSFLDLWSFSRSTLAENRLMLSFLCFPVRQSEAG